jgi:ABC-type phosphate transport system auxiliary subunit
LYNSAAPTKTQERSYELAASEFSELLPQLNKIEQELNSLQQELEKQGLPWTKGRGLPEWEK